MVNVQKITSLAFAYYDGGRQETMLTADQKQQAVRYIFISTSSATNEKQRNFQF